MASFHRILLAVTYLFALCSHLDALPPTSKYPRPILAIYGKREKAHTNELIYFDARNTFFPSPLNTTTYYLLFQFGELSAQGTPRYVVTTTNASFSSSEDALLVSTRYLTGGPKVVNLTVSDTPFTWTSHGKPLALLKNGYIAPVASHVIEITSSGDCYDYDVEVDWDPAITTTDDSAKPFSNADVNVRIKVRDHQTHNDPAADKRVTQMFASLHDYPTLKVSNSTHVYEFDVDSDLDANGYWSATLPKAIFNSKHPITMSVLSQMTAPFGCYIGPLQYDVSKPYLNSLNLGRDMAAVGSAKPAAVLANTNFQPSHLRYSEDRCSPKQSIITIGTDMEDKQFLGALILASSDGFDRVVEFRDLTKAPDGSSVTRESLCAALDSNSCRQLVIERVVLVDKYVILLTNQGLFRSEDYTVSTTNAINNQFTKLITGISAIDTPNGHLHAELQGESHCFSLDGGIVNLLYATPNSTNMTNVIYARTRDIAVNQKWSAPITIASLNLPASYSFVSVVHNFPDNTNIYLVGVKTDAACPSHCLYNGVKIIQHDLSSGEKSISFELPNDEIIYGMHIHVNDLDVFVYGQKLWHSVDGGVTFAVQFDLSDGASLGASVEYFVEMVDSRDGGFAASTNKQRLLYGRVSTHDILIINTAPKSTTGSWDTQVSYFDDLGNLYVTSLAAADYAAGVYPTGFLSTADGDLRPHEEYLVRRQQLVGALIATNDDSFPAHLIPVFLSDRRIRFFAANTDFTAAPFHTQALGSKIGSNGGGSALVVEIGSGGSFADALVDTAFTAETRDASPAVLSSLRLVGVQLTPSSKPYITEPLLTNVQLVLVNPEDNSVWRYSDIGKTVVVHQGSILITGLISSTIAQGQVFRNPLSTVDAASGYWKLYDFRAVDELAFVATESVIVSSPVGKLVNATLSGANRTFEFSSMLEGKLFDAGFGYGLVSRVYGPNDIEVSVLQTIAPDTYPAGNWSLVEATSDFWYGEVLTSQYKKRPWSLMLEDCHWSSFESSISKDVTYIGNQENITINAAIGNKNNLDLEILASSKLSVIMSNPVLYSYDVQYVASSFLSSGLELSFHDIGTKGESILSFRPSDTSLKCSSLLQTIRLVNGCPPTRYLQWDVLGYSMQQFLYETYNALGSITFVESLPPNYRPPSKYGDAVPITNNIYNADPSEPMHNNRYKVSKRNGVYKQCRGKQNRAECGCTDEQRYSMAEVDTDCVDRVLRVFHDTAFSPMFYIHQHDREPVPLTAPVRLTELNNRTDWCFTSMKRECKDKSVLLNNFDPVQDSITWEGGQLYHFRAETIDGGYCTLSAEFIVYVVEVPPSSAMLYSYMAIIAVILCFVLLAIYIVYTWRQSLGW